MSSHSLPTSRRSYESKAEESKQDYKSTTPNYLIRNESQPSDANWVAPTHIKGLTSRGNRTIRLWTNHLSNYNKFTY